MIIDAHAHVYDILAGYGAKGEFRPLGKGKGIWATGEVEQFFPAEYGDLGFRAEVLLQLMEEAGIDHAVLLQGGNYGFHNDYVIESARRWPDKFTPIVTVDPYALYVQEILDHLIGDCGARGLKFELSETWGMTGYHPDLKLDGPVFAKVLERAEKEELTAKKNEQYESYSFARAKYRELQTIQVNVQSLLRDTPEAMREHDQELS